MRATPVAWRWMVPGCGLFLACLFLWRYLGDPALPGNNASFPLGWWGWWDQGKYLDSARALAAGDLAAARHWYPLGYSLLDVPFLRLGQRMHGFFFVDLAALLVTYAAFIDFARRGAAISTRMAAVIFVLATCTDRMIFAQWVIPWNTTPVTALLWVLLALAARWMTGTRRPLALGVLLACVPMIRPTEALPALLCGAWVFGADFFLVLLGRRPARAVLRDAALTILAGVLTGLPYAALYLAIYGAHPTEYMRQSAGIGVTLHDFGWKAYVILADPRAWFRDGEGLLQRLPWVFLGLAGLLPAIASGGAPALLAVGLCLHAVVYIGYIDLLPTGLWRYNNIHYWNWAIPGYALLAFTLLRDLARWRAAPRFPVAPVSLALAVVLALIRIDPAPAVPGAPAKMLAWGGVSPGFADSYFGHLALRDGRGVVTNISDFRAIPVPGGMRVVMLSRKIGPGVTWVPAEAPLEGAGTGEVGRYQERVALGWPCWLAAGCGPRGRDRLIPPEDAR